MTNNNTFRKAGRPPKYDWQQWMDGNVHTLVLGRDIFCLSVRSMTCMVIAQAKRMGLRIRTNSHGDSITIQTLGPREDDATA